MSVNKILTEDGVKHIYPIRTEAEYRAWRDEAYNVQQAQLARQGDEGAKRRLHQANYNVLGTEGQSLRETCMLGDTFFYDYDDPDTRDTFVQRCIEQQEQTQLRLLEYSTHGVHAVFQRQQGRTILENQYRVSQQLGVEFDNQAKDPQRVVFTGPASDILFIHPNLFNYPAGESAHQEYLAMKQRVSKGQEDVPAEVKKRNKHMTSPGPSQGGVNESERGEVISANETPSLDPDRVTPPFRAIADERLVTEGKGGKGDGGEVLPYPLLLPAFFRLENPSYPNIVEGVRNDTLFNVCAKYLRYICDHSAEKMKELLYPDYSFGLPESEVEAIIHSALSRERGLTPKVVKKTIAQVQQKMKQTEDNPADSNAEASILEGNEDSHASSGKITPSLEGMGEVYPSLATCIDQDASMPRLPRWVEILLRVCPPGHRFVTLGSLMPALMTLATGVTCKFDSKKVSRLNGWSHLDGPPASGKSVIVPPINLVLTPIREEDERNTALINQAIQNRDVNRNADKLTPIPKLPIRLLPPNTTRNGHIENMANAQGRHTYTLATELSSLNIHGQGYYNRADFERLLYDNGQVGSVTKMDTSQKLVTQCNWNVTSSSTRDQTLSHWRNVTDGSVTRVMFLLMPDTTFMETPQYVQYTPAEEAYVIRAARILMELNGLVQTPRTARTLLGWLHDVLELTRQNNDSIRAMLRKRSADIGFFFGSVIHLCYIVQQIMDEEDALAKRANHLRKQQEQASDDPAQKQQLQEQLVQLEQEQIQWQAERLDLSRFHEKKNTAQLAVMAAQYALDTQYALFGKKMQYQLQASYQGVTPMNTQFDRLARVPQCFTLEQLPQIFPELRPDNIRKMVNRWEHARLVTRMERVEGKAVYQRKM